MFIDLDTGVRLHYRDGGEGKPILFIPGFSATLDTWNYAVLDLHEKYRCITVDMRGHGSSEKPVSDYTYAEMCADVKALITKLDLTDVTLVGWSMGAGVSLKYVTEFNDDNRVSKLAMVGAATPRFKQTEEHPFGMDEATAAGTLEAVRRDFPDTMAAFKAANFHRTDNGATQDWVLSTWLEMPAYAAFKYFRTLLEEDLRDNVAKVNMPTIIFHGRDDQVSDPGWVEYMAERIEGSSIVWFENSGHALMLEEADKFSAELAAFAG